mgnify:FL=1
MSSSLVDGRESEHEADRARSQRRNVGHRTSARPATDEKAGKRRDGPHGRHASLSVQVGMRSLLPFLALVGGGPGRHNVRGARRGRCRAAKACQGEILLLHDASLVNSTVVNHDKVKSSCQRGRATRVRISLLPLAASSERVPRCLPGTRSFFEWESNQPQYGLTHG